MHPVSPPSSRGDSARPEHAPLAILGGKPTFESPRPIGQLDMPDVDSFIAELKAIFGRRRLTNDGPLVAELERQLRDFHKVEHVVALANAGLALTLLMRDSAKGRSGRVIMPSFSYRGLPHFAQWAGQLPQFCEVDPSSHVLDPEHVDRLVTDDTTSILAVANAHDRGDLDGLQAVAAKHQLPLIIDSVYAMGGSYRGTPLGRFGDAEVYSLHATKLLNGFEGGYVATNSRHIADGLRWQCNFSLPGLRPADAEVDWALGLNAKLNEVHAAMALLCLQQLPQTIARNEARFRSYVRGLASLVGVRLLPYTEHERHNYQMAVLEVLPSWPLTRDQTVRVLQAEGLAITAYYSPVLHRSEHCPSAVQPPELPISEALAGRFLQLPVGELVSQSDVELICALLLRIAEQGAVIADRLGKEQRA